MDDSPESLPFARCARPRNVCLAPSPRPLRHTERGGGYIALNRQYIEQIPIRRINFSDKGDSVSHEQLVALVERMLGLHQRLPETKSPTEKTFLQRQIRATDHQIDRLVYELYGLTDEEIEVVEGGY